MGSYRYRSLVEALQTLNFPPVVSFNVGFMFICLSAQKLNFRGLYGLGTHLQAPLNRLNSALKTRRGEKAGALLVRRVFFVLFFFFAGFLI